jgi:hypothetical protein
MQRFILACCLLAASLAAHAQTAADSVLRQQVNAFIDEGHDAAAHARPAYFDRIARDGGYIGTDKTELWHRDAFKAWARRYFERKPAWTVKPIRRNVYLSADKSIIWFDELPDTQMGVCQASGVVHRTATGFEIEHYQRSIAIPNKVSGKVSATVKEFEAQPAAGQAAYAKVGVLTTGPRFRT